MPGQVASAYPSPLYLSLTLTKLSVVWGEFVVSMDQESCILCNATTDAQFWGLWEYVPSWKQQQQKKCSISIVLILHCALSISNAQRQVYRAQKLEVLHNSKIVGDESKGQSVAKQNSATWWTGRGASIGGVFSQQHGSPLRRNNDRFCAHILPLLMANTCGFSSPKTPSAFCVLGSTVVVADFLMEVKRGVNV